MKNVVALNSLPKRLNRNILECKLDSEAVFTHKIPVLIETYWNVNVLAELTALGLDAGLNRNILECKFFSFSL